jgi:hypothetical protein
VRARNGVAVVGVLVLGDHRGGMALVEDEDPVEQFAADAAGESRSDRVPVGPRTRAGIAGRPTRLRGLGGPTAGDESRVRGRVVAGVTSSPKCCRVGSSEAAIRAWSAEVIRGRRALRRSMGHQVRSSQSSGLPSLAGGRRQPRPEKFRMMSRVEVGRKFSQTLRVDDRDEIL